MMSLRKVRLNAGGYDPAGCYWGVGPALYSVADDVDCGVSFHVRGRTREAAKNAVRMIYPQARFVDDKPFKVVLYSEHDTKSPYDRVVFSCCHRSARAAARQLSQIIRGKGPIIIGAKRYVIQGDDGVERPLLVHQTYYLI